MRGYRIGSRKLAGWSAAIAVTSVALAGFAGHAASADEWPSRSLTLVVPFAAGGPTDMVGRTMPLELQRCWVSRSRSRTSAAPAVRLALRAP